MRRKSQTAVVEKQKTVPVVQIEKRRISVLTEREREVLKLFVRGSACQEIAEELELSSKTVGSYLQRVREKFRCKSRSDLVALGVREGLLE